jgi:hypothetical protein
MAMDRMGFTMITTITGTTIIIDLGGDIIGIDLGILGRITTSLIIMDGHTTVLIMHIIPIPIMATTLITIIMDRVITQIQTIMWQVAGGEALQHGELTIREVIPQTP